MYANELKWSKVSNFFEQEGGIIRTIISLTTFMVLAAATFMAALQPTTAEAINLKSGADAVAGPPVSNSSSGQTPFGFAFEQRNNLIVSEAFGGAPNASAVSSYTAAVGGVLNVVRESVPDFQTAAE